MALETLEFLAGLAIVWIALRDVFDTVVVPGEARGPLRMSRRLVDLALPAQRRMFPGGVGLSFAPLVLLASFVAWMALLVLGFGLMTHAERDSFDPPARSFGEALYLAGTALTTVGFGTSNPTGLASVLGVVGGFCGLAVMTMAVTYLLQVQANIAARDVGIVKLITAAGHPPSAVVLLERYAELGCRDELASLLRSARDWCAAVLQSHASHPSLIYFRSAGVGSGWPATLGAVVDFALMAEHLLAVPDLRGPAVLARQEGEALARELARLLHLAPVAPAATAADMAQVTQRLSQAGYALRTTDLQAFAEERRKRICCIEALARHLGTGSTVLAPRDDEHG
ncbi:Ion channel [Variovorax sp. PBS-H4]|uniref:potassium channel family protein n=1 Tax=Variovorax sp. PBS-H4 TaxID=434008 RepID=UPI001318782A|nr:potassium channel family protein [Variovorax sp. PBS-H4]VTU41211.1 Ion channel [Variovorax sp. PBS-H4]